MSGVSMLNKELVYILTGNGFETNEKMKVYNKFTQEVIGEVGVAGQKDVDAAIISCK